MGLQEPENQVPFLFICATFVPVTHFAHMKKNTLQDETNQHNTNQAFLQLKNENSSTIPHYVLLPFHSCNLYRSSCMEITSAPY